MVVRKTYKNISLEKKIKISYKMWSFFFLSFFFTLIDAFAVQKLQAGSVSFWQTVHWVLQVSITAIDAVITHLPALWSLYKDKLIFSPCSLYERCCEKQPYWACAWFHPASTSAFRVSTAQAQQRFRVSTAAPCPLGSTYADKRSVFSSCQPLLFHRCMCETFYI